MAGPHFTDEEVELLINTVKSNPVIAWAEIADKVFKGRFNETDLQTKWSHLRLLFHYHQRKWKFYKDKQFLQNLKNTGSTEDTKDPGSNQLLPDENSSQAADTQCTAQMHSGRLSPCSSPSPSSRNQQGPVMLEKKSSYETFSIFLTSELDKAKEKYGETIADKLQRKLNMCLLECLDELEADVTT